MTTRFGGKTREINDGAGLCSPGRWSPKRRRIPQWRGIMPLKSQLMTIIKEDVGDVRRCILRGACGQWKSSPFSSRALDRGRRAWIQNMADPRRWDSHEDFADLTAIPHGQPFYLSLLAEHLRHCDDPDWRVLVVGKWNYSDGVCVGAGEKLPRTPAVFPRKTHWRKYSPEDHVEWVRADNYKSAQGLEHVLQRTFEEEAALNMMVEVPEKQAQEEYPGDKLRIASLGAIEKGEEDWRIIHDGTHGVDLNPQIRPRDQQQLPAAPDEQRVLQETADSGEAAFALAGDVSKAHRRVLVLKSDWGLQACCLHPGRVWLNKVGTYGIASISYWWTRLVAAIGRGVLYVLMRALLFQSIYVDDIKWVAAGADKFDDLALAVFCWMMLGTPFAYHKFRGGPSVDYIGYRCDYLAHSLGVNDNRMQWIVRWLSEHCEAKVVQVDVFRRGLGRLTFVVLVLPFYKPFLAPFYAWLAAVPAGSSLRLPDAVLFAAKYLHNRFAWAQVSYNCKSPTLDLGEVFRTDAKAEGHVVTIGGWECRCNTPPQQARWFSLRLTPDTAPWAFDKGEPFRAIASLELLGTLVALKVFVSGSTPGTGVVSLTASTDNQGNEHLLNKLLCTKFPLNCWLAEFAAEMESRQVHLRLKWLQRDSNQEADDLTNEDFAKFDADKRLHVQFGDFKWHVFDEMLPFAKSLHEAASKSRRVLLPRLPARNAAHLSAKRRRTSASLLGAW